MNYYDEIKNELINNEINKEVKNYSINRSDLSTYYNVGKMLSKAGNHYGEGIIKKYSERLMKEVNKKYSIRLLFRMRKIYMFLNYIKVPTLSAQLTISHLDELLKLKNINEINYYIDICKYNNLSVRELRNKIKNKEYERLPEETKNKLIDNKEPEIKDLIKNPILIKNSYNYTEISEKILKQLILEDLSNFLTELGSGYSFISDEYKIKIGDRYNYIDLLLFNIEFNCYVVVELKITELKAEHIGQIKKYMGYIDKHIKSINQDKTIGIIIVRKDNEFIMEYASDPRIYRTSYMLS